MAKYGKFRGVNSYVVVAGQKADDLEERVGYYGEHLVLFAQTLGLNTCWWDSAIACSYCRKYVSTLDVRNDAGTIELYNYLEQKK